MFDEEQESTIPELYIKVKDKDGKYKDVTLKNVNREQHDDIVSKAKEGKVQVLDKEKRVIPYYHPETITSNPNVINYPRIPGTSDDFSRRTLGGIYGGATAAMTGGGPLGGLIGFLTGAYEPPNTYTDAGMQALSGKIMNVTSKGVAQVPALAGKVRQAIAQGALGAAGNLAEGTAKNIADIAVDPNRKFSNEPIIPDSATAPLGMAAAGVTGAVGGLATEALKSRMGVTPPEKSRQLYNIATGEDVKDPIALARAMKDIDSGAKPNASNTVGPMRYDRLKLEKDLENSISREKTFKELEKGNIAQANADEYVARRGNQAQIAKNKEAMMLNPALAGALEEQDNAKKILLHIDSLEDKIKKGKATNDEMKQYMLLQRDKQTHVDNYDIATKAVEQQHAAVQQTNIENLHRRYESPGPTKEGQIMPENEASLDARTRAYEAKKEQSKNDVNILQLQRQLSEKKMPLQVANILKSGENSEQIISNLMKRDVPEIRMFMESPAAKKMGNIQEGVINEVLRQSYDPETRSFSNFSKMYGTTGQAGNIRDRLQYVLGSQDKADKFLDLVSDVNSGIEAANKYDKQKTAWKGLAAGTALFQLAQGKLSHPSALAAESGMLTAVSMPNFIYKAMQTDKGYEALKKWSQDGFSSKYLVAGNPIYQLLIDAGDHYRIGLDGKPVLIERKKKEDVDKEQ